MTLTLTNLTKQYGSFTALQNFNYEFTAGVYGLLGPFYGLEVSDDLAEKLEKTAAVYDDFYGLFYGDYGEYQSLDEALFAANEQLKAAGIDEVLNELNEQHGKFDKE